MNTRKFQIGDVVTYRPTEGKIGPHPEITAIIIKKSETKRAGISFTVIPLSTIHKEFYWSLPDGEALQFAGHSARKKPYQMRLLQIGKAMDYVNALSFYKNEKEIEKALRAKRKLRHLRIQEERGLDSLSVGDRLLWDGWGTEQIVTFKSYLKSSGRISVMNHKGKDRAVDPVELTKV